MPTTMHELVSGNPDIAGDGIGDVREVDAPREDWFAGGVPAWERDL